MKRATLLVTLISLRLLSTAQQTSFINDPQGAFNQAKEYFQKEQYSLAYPLLKEIQLKQRETDRSNKALNYQEVRYYTIVCALKQNEETAVTLAKEFIELEDNASRVQMMSFHLAEYYFRKQDYSEAIPAFEKVSIDNLSNREIADLKFHLGYAYFTSNNFEQAKPLLNTIRQLPKDPNYRDANYYYGFLAFYDKNYKDALDAFTVVEDHAEYGKVVPYYIANIYYSTNQKDKALQYAEARLAKGNQYYDLELRQLVGHAYYEKKQFDKARPYLEAYVGKSKKARPNLRYAFGFKDEFGSLTTFFKNGMASLNCSPAR